MTVRLGLVAGSPRPISENESRWRRTGIAKWLEIIKKFAYERHFLRFLPSDCDKIRIEMILLVHLLVLAIHLASYQNLIKFSARLNKIVKI